MEEFKAGYKSLKEQPKPQGFIASYLLQDTHDDEICMIKTVLESEDALERMRKDETPAAPALFQKVGSQPSLKIYNVSDTLFKIQTLFKIIFNFRKKIFGGE